MVSDLRRIDLPSFQTLKEDIAPDITQWNTLTLANQDALDHSLVFKVGLFGADIDDLVLSCKYSWRQDEFCNHVDFTDYSGWAIGTVWYQDPTNKDQTWQGFCFNRDWNCFFVKYDSVSQTYTGMSFHSDYGVGEYRPEPYQVTRHSQEGNGYF